MNTNNPNKFPLFCIGLSALALLAVPASLQAQTQSCYDTNLVKFLNPPNVDGGLDVMDSRENDVLADDFLCTNTGPVTDIHFWGSWLNNIHGTVTNFWIGIYSDVPAVTNAAGQIVTPSHPGLLLWQQIFTLGQYAETPGLTGQEYFYNPTNHVVTGGDTQAWYYCFYPANPFVQRGTTTNPTNYWLAVRAQLFPDASVFGWKTSLVPYHDAAVWGTVSAVGLPNGDWQSMTNPVNNQPIDLSFKLETTNTQAVVCVETNTMKYEQDPNIDTGLDVWNSSTKPIQVTDGPWWLADDFVCTTPGTISDIHLWGSWQNDRPLPGNITFQLYVYDDVPANPLLNSPSHPGNILWHQTFTPGQYAETQPLFGQENFFDPGQELYLGPESQIWYYCFYPTNLTQTGTAAQPKIYWLAAFAELPVGTTNVFGWKTTFTVSNDVSVHAPWLGFGSAPPANAWLPNFYFSADSQKPLDLAFKVDTRTNKCPIQYLCVGADKTVTCNNPWTFDPPQVFPSSCCPAPTVLFGATTNIDGCTKTITGTWVILDCSGGTVGVCTQKVYIVIPPPIMKCPTNKSVMSGSSWTFDPPTASDACNGNVLTVTVVNTTTNGPGPCNQTYTRTWQATNSCGDASFCSQTVTNLCAPVVCVESDFDKYAQLPNILGGYDVWNNPYVLADDFVCSNTSPVSDIHLWGSWLGNSALPDSIKFWLGIYDDVPAGPGNPYSHPGTNLLWQQWFAPGQYAETIWTANASELFLNPGQSNVLGTDSVVWYYCFYPTNAFMQLGTAKAPEDLLAGCLCHQLSAGIAANSGWKTSTNVLHDASVHANWPGFAPTNNPGWTPTAYQPAPGAPAIPLDLAFKLTTCGPLTIKYVTPTNVVVTWLGGGHLQSATNVAGPYVDVPLDPPSPFKDYSVSPTNKFYRLRCYP